MPKVVELPAHLVLNIKWGESRGAKIKQPEKVE